nr:Gfo/Idh/MocA family oxidoreductase [Thomasclavelia ramosa]
MVYIPTVNSQHYENCKKALKHHKHVIVEKTFALTVLEAKELFTLRIINI